MLRLPNFCPAIGTYLIAGHYLQRRLTCLHNFHNQKIVFFTQSSVYKISLHFPYTTPLYLRTCTISLLPPTNNFTSFTTSLPIFLRTDIFLFLYFFFLTAHPPKNYIPVPYLSDSVPITLPPSLHFYKNPPTYVAILRTDILLFPYTDLHTIIFCL